MKDPLLYALFDRLPAPGEPFPAADKARWMTALSACLDVVYPAGAVTPLHPAGYRLLDAVRDLEPAPPEAELAADTPADDWRCERCSRTFTSKQGHASHMAMHRRDDKRDAHRAAPDPPPLTVAPAAAPAPTVAVLPPLADVEDDDGVTPAADDVPVTPKRPLVVAEPIARRPFDPDQVRQRSVDGMRPPGTAFT